MIVKNEPHLTFIQVMSINFFFLILCTNILIIKTLGNEKTKDENDFSVEQTCDDNSEHDLVKKYICPIVPRLPTVPTHSSNV